MSTSPIVIRCECQGLFQLPRPDMARAMCPHCQREVAIFANGTAQVVQQAHIPPTPLAPASFLARQPPPASTPSAPAWNAPSMASTNWQPTQPTWNPPPPPQKKSYVKAIVITLVVTGVGFVGSVALCAGAVYTQYNKLVAGQFTPEADVAPLAEMQTKPLVAFNDYKSRSTEAGEGAGDQMRRIADLQKSGEEFELAEISYKEALRLDPSNAMAAYQLACNYELWGDTTKAKKSFDHAMSLGFADYPTCVDDDELGAIRDMADFPRILEQVRGRYIAKCKDHVGTPVFFDPPGGVSKGLIILLHGYGDTPESYFEEALAWNALGFRAVAMPGSIPHLDGKFSWSVQSTDVTDREIQRILSDSRISQRQDKVFLMGFSQGGMHAMQVAAQHPERYAGAVVMSPGGKPWMFGTNMRLKLSGQGCFYFIYGDEEGHGMFMPKWQADCRSAGWRTDLHIHNGGHHFPEDWDERRPAVARFLLNE